MIIGLTGSMAAGKSTVSALLAEMGFYILDADRLAHEVLHSPAVTRRIAEEFGEDVLGEDGRVVHARLAEKAFSSPESTEKLNSLIHPAVIEAMLARAEEFLLEYPELPVVFDVPLLFEAGMDKYCDRVLVVAADDERRYLRIMLRDGLTREQAARRIARQMPQEDKLERADAAVWNDGTIDELRFELRKALDSLGIPVPRPHVCNLGQY